MQGNILTPTKIETEKDFLDFITPDLLPGARISTRGLSRLIGCQDTAIIDRAQVKSKKLAGMLEEKGIDPAHYRGGWTASAAWIALKYFAYKARNEYPQAEAIADTFGAIGIQTMLEKAGQQADPSTLAQWHEERISGKVVRRSLTDQIQILIKYAEVQGSENAGYYYAHFSNLVNKYVIADLKAVKTVPDKRNRMTVKQVRYVAVIEDTLSKLIGDQMTTGVDYHEIYKACKSRVAAIAAVLDIEPAPLLPESNKRLIDKSLAAMLKAQ